MLALSMLTLGSICLARIKSLGIRLCIILWKFTLHRRSKLTKCPNFNHETLVKIVKINEGDEVIVPANTFITSVFAITEDNIKLVLVKPDAAIFNLCPKKLREAITPKRIAIMAVNLYGQLAPMKEIIEIANESNPLLEITAQAHSAKCNGIRAEAFGHASRLSFYPGKNLGASKGLIL